MNIKDTLKAYYAASDPISQAMIQPVLNNKLASDLASLALNDKTLAWVNRMSKKYRPSNLHPDRLVELFAKMGIDTTDDLVLFAECLNKTKFDGVKLFDYLNPTIDVTRFTKKVTDYEVYYAIRLAGINPPIDGTWPKGNDRHYWRIPDDMVDEIFAKCPSDEYEYISEDRDCDDFSNIIRGWTSAQGKGNMLLGVIEAEFEFKGITKAAHSFIFVITESNQLWLRDGMDDKIKFKYTDPLTHYPGYDRISKIRDMRY